MSELYERLARLKALAEHDREAFDENPLLRDLVERNLEIALQAAIDMGARILRRESAPTPATYSEVFVRLAELGVISQQLGTQLAKAAGMRNVLVHEYLEVDWDIIFARLQNVSDLQAFASAIERHLAA